MKIFKSFDQVVTRIFILLALTISHHAFAYVDKFNTGPVIESYGKHASVTQTFEQSSKAAEQVFNVVFDISKQADNNSVNAGIESLARFINMNVANGVKPENIHLALVAHGKAGFDLLSDVAYREKYNMANPNTNLLNALTKQNVRVIICGQSAAYLDISNEMLHEKTEVALSAMNANAVLQQEGYTLNPF